MASESNLADIVQDMRGVSFKATEGRSWARDVRTQLEAVQLCTGSTEEEQFLIDN